MEKKEKTLFDVLTNKSIPNRDGWIYLSDGLYLNENDEIIEMS